MRDRFNGWEFADRINDEAEELKLPDDSFKGVCRYCRGVVLIPRNTTTFQIEPDQSFCIYCGQKYRTRGRFIDIEREAWEKLDAGQAF